jgi:hypothetical protein
MRQGFKLLFALALICSAVAFNPPEAKAGDTISVSGSALKVSRYSNPLYIPADGTSIDYIAGNYLIKTGNGKEYTISYSSITVPTHSTARQLKFKLDSMLDVARNSPGWRYTSKSAADSTTIKNGPGILHAIVINTKDAAAGTIKAWDGTTVLIPSIDATASVTTLIYDVRFDTKLNIKGTSIDSPASYTIIWR